ncbi:MAG: SH3 domain-containing protein [Alphaproteobacteria bacterium]
MRHNFIFAAALAVCLLTAKPVFSASGTYASEELTLRAGPGGGYPLVARLPEGTPIGIVGCTNNERWCDVAAAGLRGWISGGKLDSAATEGQPEVTFDEYAYWSGNYATSDFFLKEYGVRAEYGGRYREGNHWVYTTNFSNGDFDSDGIPDATDNDDDGDGIRDKSDLDKDNDHFVDIWNRADLHAHRRELRE